MSKEEKVLPWAKSGGDQKNKRTGTPAYDLEKPVHVVAIAKGYYGNRIINEGQKFLYNGRVKKINGDFVLPLWVRLNSKVEDNEIIPVLEKKSSPKPSSKPKASSSASDLV